MSGDAKAWVCMVVCTMLTVCFITASVTTYYTLKSQRNHKTVVYQIEANIKTP